LDGLKIAITGLLDTFGREEIEDLIKTYGGKVSVDVTISQF
jgi:BRCT domain type II-containing protein